MNPNRPKNAAAIAPLAAENRALANSVTSNSGSTRRTSHQTNPASRAADPTRPPIVTADPQPCAGASMIVQTSRPTPAIDPTAPNGSNLPGLGSRDSWTSARMATIATTASGTFTRNTADQLKCSTSNPPPTGPSATDRPVTPDQMPMAAARSLRSGNSDTNRARVAGKISAAPTPIAARPAMRPVVEVAS